MVKTNTIYKLDAKLVKLTIDAIINKQYYNEEQFMYFHLFRNFFNVKEIKWLIKLPDDRFLDNHQKIWNETHVLFNMYHMPLPNWFESIHGVAKPYSRKFLRYDNETGIGGEFEMIIREHDGKRIDALTHALYQETCNFGRTDDWLKHKRLDIDPHTENRNYLYKKPMGYVTIYK